MRKPFLLLLLPTLAAANDYPKTLNTQAGAVKVSVLASNLSVPWGIAFLPAGGALIAERPGRLRHLDPATGALTNVSGVPAVHAEGQGGLLDVQLHPQFKTNQKVYLCYSRRDGDTNTTALGSGQLVGAELKGFKQIFAARPGFDTVHHFGCRIQFAPDGKLFLSIGDRHQRDLAQDLDAHMGKLLRLNDDGSAAKDNPFVGKKDALPEIYSYGHRNAQGLAIHPQTGVPWLNEHGPRGGDEINQALPGRNYGWPEITFGREYYGPKIGSGTAKTGMEQPVHQWTPSIGPSGLLIYTGKAFPAWKGDLFSGALALTHLNRVTIKGGKVSNEERLFDDLNLRVRDVEQDAAGNLILLTDAGLVLKVEPG